ncbi:receptor-like protein EIX1 [Eucalyptus grandis]|uniref:receptor-like protein EIX1 n=1 Tax=Eucalyptus grandis TaxID=71139 RepID=UPI00192E78B3|nr:receptor-like protein EIX1 [Eucalyptus grandis]
MASYFYISFVSLLLCAIFVIQASEFSQSKVSTNVSCIGVEREALVKFKQELTDPSKRLWSWIGKDCCKWQGVTCNEKTGHVSKLDLRNPCDGLERCSLGGKIHIAANKLKHLKYLDLSFNNFSTQKIPESLASLKRLEYLNLSNGGFYGDIPHQLSNLSNLQYLDLSSGWSVHSLKIENSRWLSTFSNLKYLDLSNTYGLDSKEWLSPINMLSSLEVLILSGCGLEDVPASQHVNFTSLRFLDLSYNSVNSSIPHWFQNFSKLEHLDLSNNDLQGIFPVVILENSPWLRFFDVSGNKLEGELLKNLSIFCNLQVLSLCYNKFSGRIFDIKGDALICGQSNLKTIDVSNNNFNGHLPNQFGNFKDLEILDLSWNSILGPIPTSVGQLLSLRMLQLSSNKLSGNIPKSIGQLSNLEVMDIGDNQLDGVVNELHFSSLTSLTSLYFWWNELVINVSASWVPPFQIQAIFMSSCKVGPKFPNWLRTQRALSALDMSNVSISDEVPYWLSDVLSDIEELNLSDFVLTFVSYSDTFMKVQVD